MAGEAEVISLKTSCLKMLDKMRPDRLKMHQKAFGVRAEPGPAGGAYSTPPDPLAGLKGAYF